MLYYLFDFLDKTYDLPGAGLFQFITFRAALAVITSLLIATVWGKKIIKILQDKQMGETIRDLGLQGQSEKAGTPTMGGLIIILATLIPVLLFAKLDNIYVILLIVTTLWMGPLPPPPRGACCGWVWFGRCEAFLRGRLSGALGWLGVPNTTL